MLIGIFWDCSAWKARGEPMEPRLTWLVKLTLSAVWLISPVEPLKTFRDKPFAEGWSIQIVI